MNDAVPSATHAEGSAVPESSAPNIVNIPCYCVDTPHDFDTVTLAPDVSVPLGSAAMAVIREATDVAVATGDLLSVYLQHGVTGWTLTDEQGRPEVPSRRNILRRLTFDRGGYEVGEAADELYSPVVMRPLLAARQRSSQRGRKAPSTSQTNGSGPKRPRPSMPSSPSGTVGAKFVETAP